MNKLRDIWYYYGEVIVAVCAVTLIAVGMNRLAKVSCARDAGIREVQYKYNHMTGCYIKYNNQWVPVKSVGVITTESN